MSALIARFPGLDPATGMLSLPLWTAGAAAALLVVFCVLAFSRAGREGVVGGLARVALVLIGAGVTLFFLDVTSHRDVAADRRALDARALELLTRAALPGSALACLDGSAGDTVESSCEKSLFATPEAIATAVSYVSAQLTLLADFNDLARRSRAGEPAALVNLRHAAEADRFGLVAQVLAVRDGCTPSECQALSLFNDSGRISANLSERTYEFYVVRHAGSWPAIVKPPVASLPPSGAPSVTAGRGVPPGGLFFPSSASIPPVNIMNTEPAVPEPPPPSAAAPAPKQTPTPPRRPTAQRPPVDLNAARGTPPATTQ
jgi:hypothetical protein